MGSQKNIFLNSQHAMFILLKVESFFCDGIHTMILAHVVPGTHILNKIVYTLICVHCMLVYVYLYRLSVYVIHYFL